MSPEALGDTASEFPLWNFSLTFYGRLGVAPALLDLQEKFGADVNLVLFGLWRAREGLRLTPEDFAALDAEIGEWRRCVVLPARELRRAIKQQCHGSEETLYGESKRLELQSEYIQQQRMYRSAHLAAGINGHSLHDAGVHNLRAYAEFMGKPFPDGAAQQLLAALLDMVAE